MPDNLPSGEAPKEPSAPSSGTARKPEISNPVKLAFRLSEVPWRQETTVRLSSGQTVAAIRLADIFRDDLQRTLWLAIKSRHLASQDFNHQIVEAAAQIRRKPPQDAGDLHYAIEPMTGRHVDDYNKFPGPDTFCRELLPYVFAALHGAKDSQLQYEEPVPANGADPSHSASPEGKP